MNTLIDNLIDLMQTAELSKLNGLEKKDFVLDKMQKLFDLDDAKVEMISEFIDIIILLDKNKIKIQKSAKKIFICF